MTLIRSHHPLLSKLYVYVLSFHTSSVCYQDHQMRQEADRAKRKLETELQDVKEQLAERRAQLEELQIVLSKYLIAYRSPLDRGLLKIYQVGQGNW